METTEGTVERPPPFVLGLLQAEILFTVLPVFVLPFVAFVSWLLLPQVVGLYMLFLPFVYFLPANLIVNGLGYRTVQGAVPVPVPATSLEGFVLILAAHALIVAMVFTIGRTSRAFKKQ